MGVPRVSISAMSLGQADIAIGKKGTNAGNLQSLGLVRFPSRIPAFLVFLPMTENAQVLADFDARGLANGENLCKSLGA
jgi:hypothetical protein